MESRFPCPCCGYPTLEVRCSWDICELCSWEDDGQDDPHADEIWGGPNQGYSLSEARNNFKKRLIMYEPSKPRATENTPAVSEAKRTLMQLFDKLPEETDEREQQSLWHQVHEAEAVLRSVKYPGTAR